MADSVKLSSLRVSADLNASGYVAGAESVTVANEDMSSSAKTVGTSITTTQAKVNGAGDAWTRLSRQYVDGAAASQKFDTAIRTLQRGLDTGSVSSAQAEQVLEGLNKRFGLTADAEALAANGQKDLASIAAAVNSRLTSQGAANDNLTRKIGLSRVQVQMFTHEGKAMFDMLSAGASPMRALSLESAGLVDALSVGEGGIAGSLAALAPILLPLIAIFGALAVAFGAFTSSLDQGKAKAINFGQALKGTFVTLWQAFTSQFKDAPTWFKGIWDQLGKVVGDGINGMIQDVAILGATIDEFLKTLPDRFAVYWADAVNFGISALNKITDAINNVLAAAGMKGNLTPAQTHVPFMSVDPAVSARVNSSDTALQSRITGIRGTDYLGQVYKNGLAGGKKTGAGSKRDPWQELMTSAANDTRTLQAQTAALGQSTQQTAYLEEKQKLLNKAYQDNIKLSPDQLKAIDSQAQAYANAKAQLELMTELYDTGKQATEDFFSTLKQDLMNGTSLWGAFGDAASKVLDDIANKALQMASDGIWNLLWGGLTGSGGGSFNLLSLFGLGGGSSSMPTGLGETGGFGSSYDAGGYTGAGGRYQVAGVVHRGEVVWSQADVARHGGAGVVDAMRRGLPGYADGGYVGAMPTSFPASPRISVNVTNNSGQDVDAKTIKVSQSGKGIDVDMVISKQVATPGTATARSLATTYGLRRSLTRR